MSDSRSNISDSQGIILKSSYVEEMSKLENDNEATIQSVADSSEQIPEIDSVDNATEQKFVQESLSIDKDIDEVALDNFKSEEDRIAPFVGDQASVEVNQQSDTTDNKATLYDKSNSFDYVSGDRPDVSNDLLTSSTTHAQQQNTNVTFLKQTETNRSAVKDDLNLSSITLQDSLTEKATLTSIEDLDITTPLTESNGQYSNSELQRELARVQGELARIKKQLETNKAAGLTDTTSETLGTEDLDSESGNVVSTVEIESEKTNSIDTTSNDIEELLGNDEEYKKVDASEDNIEFNETMIGAGSQVADDIIEDMSEINSIESIDDNVEMVSEIDSISNTDAVLDAFEAKSLSEHNEMPHKHTEESTIKKKSKEEPHDIVERADEKNGDTVSEIELTVDNSTSLDAISDIGNTEIEDIDNSNDISEEDQSAIPINNIDEDALTSLINQDGAPTVSSEQLDISSELNGQASGATINTRGVIIKEGNEQLDTADIASSFHVDNKESTKDIEGVPTTSPTDGTTNNDIEYGLEDTISIDEIDTIMDNDDIDVENNENIHYPIPGLKPVENMQEEKQVNDQSIASSDDYVSQKSEPSEDTDIDDSVFVSAIDDDENIGNIDNAVEENSSSLDDIVTDEGAIETYDETPESISESHEETGAFDSDSIDFIDSFEDISLDEDAQEDGSENDKADEAKNSNHRDAEDELHLTNLSALDADEDIDIADSTDDGVNASDIIKTIDSERNDVEEDAVIHDDNIVSNETTDNFSIDNHERITIESVHKPIDEVEQAESLDAMEDIDGDDVDSVETIDGTGVEELVEELQELTQPSAMTHTNELESQEGNTSNKIDSPSVVMNREDLKTIMGYMDELLEKLPEQTIDEFAHSEYFELYERLFDELGLHTKQ